MSLTLYGSPYSTFTWSVRLALAEKGLACTLAPAKLGSPEYGAMHPYRKMPTLDHDGFVLFEAAAVMDYLDEAFEGPALKPAGVRERARMWQWASAFSDYVAPAAVRGVLIPRLVLGPRGIAVDDAAVHAAAAKARGHLVPFNTALAGSSFLAGDSVSLADFLVLPVYATGVSLAGPDRYTEDLPHLDAWFSRMSARSSFEACLPDRAGT